LRLRARWRRSRSGGHIAPLDDYRQAAAWPQRNAQQRLGLYAWCESPSKPRSNAGKENRSLLERECGAEADTRAGAKW
jgi:hypothetical protein